MNIVPGANRNSHDLLLLHVLDPASVYKVQEALLRDSPPLAVGRSGAAVQGVPDVRPRRDRETVQARHVRIVALRRGGGTLKEIAPEVGLKTHASVIHHANRRCICLDGVRDDA